MTKKSAQQVGAVLFALLMLTSPAVATVQIGPGPATATSADNQVAQTGQLNADLAGEARAAQLSTGLQLKLQQADANDKVPVILVFEQQPSETFDLSQFTSSQAHTKLKEFAQQRQERVRSYLKTQRQRGQATDITPFWIRNEIAVKATPATIRELATSQDISRIIYDQKITPLGSQSGQLSTFVSELRKHGNLTAAPSGFQRDTSGQRAWGVEYIGADAVQEHGVTGDGVNVSVVDTGIDDEHPALRGQVTKWKDFTNDNFSDPRDPIGHGTHVAGTIAGKPSADYAVGTAPGANLFGAKVFGSQGSGRLSDAMAAFQWSVENDADVISASLGVSPIYEYLNGTTTVSDESTQSTQIEVHPNASSIVNSSDLEADGFKPSYAMVLIEPTSANGTQLSKETKSQVMSNLSVTMVGPNKTQPLQKIEADWAFETGEVPSTMGLWKFKPDSSRKLQSGNWSLNVSNQYSENVTYEYTVLPVYPSNGSDHFATFVNDLTTSSNVVPVIAAGNSGYLFGNRSLGSPGVAKSAITVGATSYKVNDVASYSSRGPVDYGTETRPGVDVIAPGTSILSSYPRNLTLEGNEPYRVASGTSMAAPHVSGTVALLLAANSSLSRTEITQALEETAQQTPAGTNADGAGVIDAWKAVSAVSNIEEAPAQTEAGIHELHAGIGGTGRNWVYKDLQPVTDPQGDNGNAPDIRATKRSFLGGEEVELATYNNTPRNASFTFYLDVDQNDSTGDPNAQGSEYRIVADRHYNTSTGYDLTFTEQKYNNSTYAQSDNFWMHVDDIQGNFIEFWVRSDSNVQPVDWHVIARGNETTGSDRFPDQGQQSPSANSSVKGIAVAWNASAGQAEEGVPVNFTLYSETSGEIANATVTTGPNGYANTTLDTKGIGDYRLEVTDPYGNRIAQTYDLSGACIEGCLVPISGTTGSFPYTVSDPTYRTERNESVEVAIPIYRSNNSSFEKYSGPASLQLTNYELDNENETVTIDNLSVDNGVLRTTINLGQLQIDDRGYGAEIDLALTENFSAAEQWTWAGDLVFEQDAVSTQLGPRTQIAPVGGNATLTFQHHQRAKDGGTNSVAADAKYRVTWITDRQVASLYRDLPAATVSKIQQIRQDTLDGPGTDTSLSSADKMELREAVQNLTETQGTNLKVERGIAESAVHGTGTFDISPPADARFGIVRAQANDTAATDTGFSLVFAGNRLAKYTDKQTEPKEGTRYNLRVWSEWDDWGTHKEGDYYVPNSTYQVHVSLYDYKTDSYVSGATVQLYSVSGNITSVTTDGDGRTSVTMSAPSYDWPNATYAQQEQEVIGFAKGYNTGDGNALMEEAYLYGYAYRIEDSEESTSSDVVYPYTELTYDNSTLTTSIEYRNSSYELTDGVETLVTLSTPSGYASARSLFVDFITPSGNTTSFNTTVDIPADDSRTYEARAQTPLMPSEWWYGDSTYINGFQTEVNAPDTIQAGEQATVTINVTNRNGQPIKGAAVIWRYTEVYPRNLDRSFQSNLPAVRDGETFIGTTNKNGTVTFTFTADVSRSETALRYQTGVATENASRSRVNSGRIAIQTEQYTVTGTVNEADGDAAANDTVVGLAASADTQDANRAAETNSDGSFTLDGLLAGTNYSIQYYQSAFTSSPDFTRDGSPDMYALAQLPNLSQDRNLGTTDLPAAYPVNVSVVDENGDPVDDARVQLVHHRGDASAGWVNTTRSDGLIYPDGEQVGLELAGNVTVKVTPPEGSERFVTQTVRENLTVTSATNLTVTLDERAALTANGTIQEAGGEPAANDTVVVESESDLEENTRTTLTNETGAFSVELFRDETQDLEYYQANGTAGTPFPTDGSPDLYPLGEVNGTQSISFGTVTLPTATHVNVTVVNESGQPVANATVDIVSKHANATASVDDIRTNDGGLMDIPQSDGPGLDLAGNVTFAVQPPTNASSYFTTTYVRDVNATSTSSVTVTLEEKPTVNATPTTPNINVTPVTLKVIQPEINGTTPASYHWEFGDDTTVETSTPNTTHVFSELGTQTVTVTLFDSNGDALYTASQNVTVGDTVPPVVQADVPSTTIVDTEFTVNASASTDNHKIANYTFTTDTGRTITSTTPSANFTFTSVGEHSVTITVTDARGNTNSSTYTVSVVDQSDLVASVAVDDKQRIQDSVTANISVTNVGTRDADADIPYTVTITGQSASATRNGTISGLASNETYNRTLDITSWARTNNVTGDIAISLSVSSPSTVDEANLANNNASATTTITYSNLTTSLYVPDTAIQGANTTVYAIIKNTGTAPSDAHSATLETSSGLLISSIEVPALQAGEVYTVNETARFEQNRTIKLTVAGDTLFPGGNTSEADLTVVPYSLSVGNVTSPAEAHTGSAFYVVAEYSANTPGDVTATIDLPSELSLERGQTTKTVYAQGEGQTDTVTWLVSADNGQMKPYTFNVSISAHSEAANGSTQTHVLVPKTWVRNSTQLQLSGNNSTQTAIAVPNATTFNQSLSISVQAGAQGRTLKGLDYLVEYPYGCVEQTTSPMLAALYTDQYYRNGTIEYDESKINGSIESGVDRLAPNGSTEANAQHANGAWSMWGADPSGDMFYTAYALFGTTSVSNDPIQSDRPAVRDDLREVNYSEAVNWLAANQNADGSFTPQYYFGDKRAITGFVLVSLNKAEQTNLTPAAERNLTAIRENATQYLVETQTKTGAWKHYASSGGNAMSTSLSVWGLQTAKASGDVHNVTQVTQAIESGQSWLVQAQTESGYWERYRSSSSWSVTGDRSETTAYALLALNASGVPATNQTIQEGTTYLTGVYEQDGSWGYTRATALSIHALQKLSLNQSVDQTVTVTIGTQSNPAIINKTINVSGQDSLQTITLTNVANETELQQLRSASNNSTRVVHIESSGQGIVYVSVDNEQLVDESEYEAQSR